MELTIIGCGLTGSHIPYPLGASMASAPWSAKVSFVDFDTIEPRNAPASLPALNPVEKSKFVSGMAQQMNVNANGYVNKVTPKNADTTIGTPDILIGAVDNDETRYIMLLYSASKNIPYIDVGVNEFAGRVSWSYGEEVNTHPFSIHNMKSVVKKEEEEKLPPCALYGTRKHAVLIVENAIQSVATFLVGHDPHDIVLSLTGRKAKRGDMVGWSLKEDSGKTEIAPYFAGSVEI